jgi:hypothetical protein
MGRDDIERFRRWSSRGHQAPIVPVPPGLQAAFHFGGLDRNDPALRIADAHSDVPGLGALCAFVTTQCSP